MANLPHASPLSRPSSAAVGGSGHHMEGFLTKRGAVRKNWKKRWFVLTTTGVLSYFPERFSAEPLGTVSLAGCILCTDGKRRENLGVDRDSVVSPDEGREKSSFSLSRSNPNVFSVIARAYEDQGKAKRGTDIPLSTFSGGEVSPPGRLSSRRYFLTAPTRQLRLDWMASIAPFAAQVVGDPDVVRELQGMIAERERVRAEAETAAAALARETASTSGGSNTATERLRDDGGASQGEPASVSNHASTHFIAQMIQEFDSFALDLPQNRQAVMLSGIVHAGPRLSLSQLEKILGHLVFDDDREIFLALALEKGCFSDEDLAALAQSESERTAFLLPLERHAISSWISRSR